MPEPVDPRIEHPAEQRAGDTPSAGARSLPSRDVQDPGGATRSPVESAASGSA
jgi:hypothetical protein